MSAIYHFRKTIKRFCYNNDADKNSLGQMAHVRNKIEGEGIGQTCNKNTV